MSYPGPMTNFTAGEQTANLLRMGQPDWLRKAREVAGFETQKAFAAASGLSRSAINMAEKGRVTPNRSALRVWAMTCGVPLGYLQTGEWPEGWTNDGAALPANPPGLGEGGSGWMYVQAAA